MPKPSSIFTSESPPSCLAQLIQQRAEQMPESTAILAPGRVALNARKLAVLSRDFHHHLRLCGIVRTDRVAVLLPSSPELATAFLAIASSAICVPLPPALTIAEAARRLTDTHAKALVTTAGQNAEIPALAKRLGLTIINLTISTASPAGWFEWANRQAVSEPDGCGVSANSPALPPRGKK